MGTDNNYTSYIKKYYTVDNVLKTENYRRIESSSGYGTFEIPYIFYILVSVIESEFILLFLMILIFKIFTIILIYSIIVILFF